MMGSVRFWGLAACTLLAAATVRPASALESELVATSHSSVRLVAPTASARAGEPFRLGISFTLKPGWHIYWQNPGESGEAPKLRWSLPPGIEAGPVEWPTPERIQTKSVVSFGFDGTPLLGTTLRPLGAFAPRAGQARVALRLNWLACEEDSCVPASAELALDVPITPEPPAPDPRWAPAFTLLDRQQPTRVGATIDERKDGKLALRLDASALGTNRTGARFAFFPREPGVVDEGEEAEITAARDHIEILLSRGANPPAVPSGFGGLLVVDVAGNERSYDVGAPRDEAARARIDVPAAAETRDDTPLATDLRPRIGATVAILFAFLGGLLLNLMPCVFPVLSLKVLAFVERAHGDARGVRSQGWAFASGVMVSFWLLAGALLAVRAGGAELGWGFQLQSPLFIALLAYLLFALALSLVGVFDVMPSLGGGFAGRAESRSGHAGSFWTGALATIVATPCTAPFMGPALGFALTQPPTVAMAVFSALGAGMAAPYVALAYFPSALRLLPKPGVWMERFRQLMAFPLFATVLWLASVFERQTDVTALMQLLTGLLVVAFALWLWGAPRRAIRRSLAATMAAIALAAVGFGLGISAASRAPAAVAENIAADGFWEPWSPARVEALRADGHGVFVNFTAAWCLTCKVNERAIFARSDVREVFARHRVVALEADWTNENADITNALASFGRDGVPLYVFYPAGLDGDPVLLPQVPTRQHLEAVFSGRG